MSEGSIMFTSTRRSVTARVVKCLHVYSVIPKEAITISKPRTIVTVPKMLICLAY
jgi:hypothetical protein